MKKLIFTLLALIITFSSFSQRDPDETYLSAFVYTPKDGMREKFEAAAAKKTQMFNNKEGNYIVTYRILSGQNEGSYLRLLISQNSSNYNNLLSDDEGKYWEKNVAPYVKSASGMQTWELLSWASVGEDGPPPKFMERSLWVSKPGQDDNVRRTIYRSGQVLDKIMSSNTLRRAFQLVSGGNPNTYAAFRGFNEYPHWGNSEQTFEEVYNELFGWRQFEQDVKATNNSLLDWGRDVITLQRVDNMLPSDIRSQISN
jgi:hypothetical protein